jgi:hypothetical protein
MARKYACIMASLGMTLVLLRAVKSGASSFEATLMTALFWMITFGMVGLLVGAIARSTVDESVRQRMQTEMAARNQA